MAQPATAAAEQAPKKRRSCLAKTIVSGIDGGIIGGILGGIMSSRTALAFGFSADGFRILFRGTLQSAVSFGGFLAFYNGGICSMEQLRGKRDFANPFILGGLMGVGGALPGYVTPIPSAPWAYRNPRAVVGAGLSSALLCTFFWGMSQRPAEVAAPTSPPGTTSLPAQIPQGPVPQGPGGGNSDMLHTTQSLEDTASPSPDPSVVSLYNDAQAMPQDSYEPPSEFEHTQAPAVATPRELQQQASDAAPVSSEELQDPWAGKN